MKKYRKRTQAELIQSAEWRLADKKRDATVAFKKLEELTDLKDNSTINEAIKIVKEYRKKLDQQL